MFLALEINTSIRIDSHTNAAAIASAVPLTLYLSNLDVNIVLGQKYYRAGGILIKETFYGTDKKPCGALNVKKYGFFLIIEGKKPLIINTLAYYYMVRQACELYPVRDRLIIKLPEKPNIRPKEYIKVPIIPELKDI